MQARRLITFGWFSLALAMLYSTRQIDLQIGFNTALWLRVAQVFGMGFLFVPITLAAYIGIPPEKNNAVSGIVNFMRNIGSSVGTSIVTTLLARRAQFHQQVLIGHTVAGNPRFQRTVNNLSDQLARAGLGKTWRAYSGLLQDLSDHPGAGQRRRLYRYIHGPSRRFYHHVLPLFCLEEKRSQRRPCGG